jgi:CubicO group peptidase (beta-lactamase class C family)
VAGTRARAQRGRGRYVVLALVLVLAAACFADSDEKPSDRVCDDTACISAVKLGQSLDRQLQGHVVGYVVLAGSSQVFAGGQARKDSDPPGRTMGPEVMVNTASVGKLFTTIAVLKSLAGHGRSIHTKIRPFLPPDWVQGPHVDTITFGELLTHTAGFRHDSGRIFKTDAAAQEQIRLGVQSSAKHELVYNNINFSILRDLLPAMEGQPDPGGGRRAEAADRFFTRFIQREVFEPVAVKDAACAPVRDPMLFYPPPAVTDVAGATAPVGPSACSAGGWFMTPSSMRRVLEGLLAGSLLPDAARRQMDQQCLGWDCVAGVPSKIRSKSGGFGDNRAALETYAGIVMDRVPVVIATNSSFGQPLPYVVATALSDATVP